MNIKMLLSAYTLNKYNKKIIVSASLFQCHEWINKILLIYLKSIIFLSYRGVRTPKHSKNNNNNNTRPCTHMKTQNNCEYV